MKSNLVSSLQTHFGFSNFRPGQAESIQNLLDNQHTLVVMPTGSGKSLIFQLVALQLPGVTLVISPLIALMKDQVDSLERRGISATFINSTLSGGEQSQRLKYLASGGYRIVYVAPERLRSTQFIHALHSQQISLLAVDEAHCISEWGHDFRPDYLHIAPFRAAFGNPLTAALTATATPKIQEDIARSLGISQIQRVVTGFNRPNLALEVRYVQDQIARLKVLQELLESVKDGAAIIYTGTRRDAEEVGEFISTVVGIRAQHYHAGLPAEERSRIQDEFMAGDLAVVAATNAFGMGIDRPDVRQVIHYSLPGSLEAYYQEAGRAGRDDLPARAVLLYAPEDRALQEWFIENSVITIKDLQLLLKALQPASAKQQAITPDDLSRSTGLQEVKVRVGLSELERAGILEHLGDEGMRMSIKLHAWKNLEIQAVTDRLQQHQAHRKTQLNRMIVYAESNTCRRVILLKHFGDMGPAEAEICCDNCQAHQPILPVITPTQTLKQSERVALIVLDTVRRLPRGVGKEKIVQILKGSRAKEIMQFGYDKTTYYGRLVVCSSAELRQVVDQLIEKRYLKVIGGEYPVVGLTPQGEAAIRDKAAIDLKLSCQIDSQDIERKKAELQAGGTLEFTAQLLSDGLTIEQITAQRGLTPMTIYGHAANLIAAGRVKVDAVVPNDVRQKIEAAICQVGSVEYLYPIKELLPDEIDYNVIRCVVEDWKRRQTLAADGITQEAQPAPYNAKGQLEKISVIILDCVRAIPGKLPRSGVAKLLVGSGSERVRDFHHHPFYNRLGGHSQSEILHEVDQLLVNGFMKKDENGHLVPGNSGKAIQITTQSLPKPSIQHIVALGDSRSALAVSELVIYLQSQDGNIRRLAASALGKIADKQATTHLMELLSREDQPQVRQYTVKALSKIGDTSAKSMLEAIAQDDQEKEYTREAARDAIKRLSSSEEKIRRSSVGMDRPYPATPPEDPVAAFLSHSHPRPLTGPWQVGWALGFHSQFAGADWNRSKIGELAYRLKYQCDISVLPELVEQAVALVADRPELAEVDAIVPVPPSKLRPNDPVSSFAKALAQQLNLAFLPVLTKSRQTLPQKEMHTLAQKRANISGAFDLQSPIRGKRLLVVDDLFDSGATLEEITRLLQHTGATQVNVLTLTRTIHSDA